FQAEDGIRDFHVTGVQTCALPISNEIRAVGVGELLARIEALKKVLAAEGLFDVSRKRPLPFLPAVVGLVCGRESKAEHDVVVNARARWPQVRFEIREVAVQGNRAVPEVSAAIAELDARREVEVIVVARGGGSVEDLLPFSNEALVRAAAACRTPIVSAIGHETDNPLLDLVADYRASTPTDAAKRVVPDVAHEREALRAVRHRLRAIVRHRLDGEEHRLAALRSRPVLVDPTRILDTHVAQLDGIRDRSRRAFDTHVQAAAAQVATLRTALRTLSPQATLDRGYAVLRTADGEVVRSPDQVDVGDPLTALVARGRLDLEVPGADGDDDAPPVIGSTS